VKISLGTFLRFGIESELGADLASSVRTALGHYSDKVRSGEALQAPPRFLSEPPAPADSYRLDLSLDPELEATLEREAARHGVDVATLVNHSLHAYLADLDLLAAPAARTS
jgi:hypothetical protein